MTTSPFARHEFAPPPPRPALPRPGDGTRLTVNALGHTTGVSAGGATFNHPFRPTLGGGSIIFRLGTVASLAGDGPLEPKIKVNGQLVPMSGKDGISPVPLALGANVANADGISWAALEVHPDDQGELWKDSAVEIVHTATPVSHARNIGRAAIAMIIWSGGNPLRVLPILHFNLRYFRILAGAGNPTGAPKHLFL